MNKVYILTQRQQASVPDTDWGVYSTAPKAQDAMEKLREYLTSEIREQYKRRYPKINDEPEREESIRIAVSRLSFRVRAIELDGEPWGKQDVVPLTPYPVSSAEYAPVDSVPATINLDAVHSTYGGIRIEPGPRIQWGHPREWDSIRVIEEERNSSRYDTEDNREENSG